MMCARSPCKQFTCAAKTADTNCGNGEEWDGMVEPSGGCVAVSCDSESACSDGEVCKPEDRCVTFFFILFFPRTRWGHPTPLPSPPPSLYSLKSVASYLCSGDYADVRNIDDSSHPPDLASDPHARSSHAPPLEKKPTNNASKATTAALLQTTRPVHATLAQWMVSAGKRARRILILPATRSARQMMQGTVSAAPPSTTKVGAPVSPTANGM